MDNENLISFPSNYCDFQTQNMCGEIKLLNNSMIIEFTLHCVKCQYKTDIFDNFKNHFLEEHFIIEKNSNRTRLKDNFNLNICEKPKSTVVTNSNTIISEEANNSFETKFKEFYVNQFVCNSSSSSETLESETKSQSPYTIKTTNSFSDYGVNGLIFDESDEIRISRAPSVQGSCINKISNNACSTTGKNKLQEKTIEIYKEHYEPKKPKFILAAVNLPIKSPSNEDSDEESNLFNQIIETDPELFPSSVDNANEKEIINEKLDSLCKPVFKFNNIKFRRQQNEEYYLSIEKTLRDGFYYCPDCNKRYKRIETLRYHYLSHSGTPAPFQCSICQKGFPSAYKVRIHFTKHTGERPFRCHLCPKVYRHKQQLKLHLESHPELNLN